MYIAAVLSKDKELQEVFISGGDFHSSIAKKAFKLPCSVPEVKEYYAEKRSAAKAISFGILYQASASKIASTADLTLPEAQELIKDYFSTFYKLKSWIDKTKKEIETKGFIFSPFGRKRRLLNVQSEDKAIKAHEIRSGLNMVIQSVN